MVDILIPTYNREQDIIKNIEHINDLVKSENIKDSFRVLISDNCSTDSTWGRIKELERNIEIEVVKYQQDENIGLERNAVFLLQQAKSDFIMYLGDDDYIPHGYLSYVINKLNEDSNISAVVPGNAALFVDGTTRVSRKEKFDKKKFLPGFFSALQVSYLGHQLSGLVLRRDYLEQEYLKNPSNRNIYPFIFFLAFNALRGNVYYAPSFNVLITTSNKKDWGYDDSGLLTEIFKNFNILYPDKPIKRTLMCCSVLQKQGGWRLRVGKRPFLAIKAILHIWSERQAGLLTKIGVLFFVPYLYTRKIVSFCKRRFAELKNV